MNDLDRGRPLILPHPSEVIDRAHLETVVDEDTTSWFRPEQAINGHLTRRDVWVFAAGILATIAVLAVIELVTR